MAPLELFFRALVGSVLVTLVTACAGCTPARLAPPPPPYVPVAKADAEGPSAPIRYSVSFEPVGQMLAVEAVFPKGTPASFAVENGSEAWLEDLRVAPLDARSEAFVPLGLAADGMVHAACAAGCTLRYRYALGASGRRRKDIDCARTDGPYVEAPPSTWLLAPVGGNPETQLSFDVHVPEGTVFVSGLGADADGSRRTSVGALRRSPYSAFGPFEVISVVERDVTLSIALPRQGRTIEASRVVTWAKKSAAAVRAALGVFPAKHAALLVSVNSGDDVDVGFSLAGSSIILRVGEHTSEATFAKDWVLTHEMLHFACPSQPVSRDWAEEGLATYVEPFARVRAGLVSREEAWKGLVRGFPYGQPDSDDRGLDLTRTWGRVYWGGALFYFEADYAIRTRTSGKKTLFDALGAIVAAGGTNPSAWSLEKAFAIGDAATGVPVLGEMLARYGATPEPFAYEAHLTELGVRSGKSSVELDGSAPRADLTRAW